MYLKFVKSKNVERRSCSKCLYIWNENVTQYMTLDADTDVIILFGLQISLYRWWSVVSEQAVRSKAIYKRAVYSSVFRIGRPPLFNIYTVRRIIIIIIVRV